MKVAHTLAPFLGDFHTMTYPERICFLCVTGSDVEAQKLLWFDACITVDWGCRSCEI